MTASSSFSPDFSARTSLQSSLHCLPTSRHAQSWYTACVAACQAASRRSLSILVHTLLQPACKENAAVQQGVLAKVKG